MFHVKHFDRRNMLARYIRWMGSRGIGPFVVPLRAVCHIRAKDLRPPRSTIDILKDLGGKRVRDGRRITGYRFETGDTHEQHVDTDE